MNEMFGGLFDEGAAQFDAKQASEGGGFRIARPGSTRNSTRLCGLSNLGATCYLNSLLQTLYFTPEFREAILTLREEELGVYSKEEGADNSMVRVIPIQLQKLFARLLLLNQQSVAVDALTSSFGWRNNEELQQHDVQELNRILFAAIESSLLGTNGERLISQLYHGITVQQVTCQVCGRVSEREEEFLDIPVALSGRAGLEQALENMYIDTELLEGANQYKCENCRQLVDARRGCRLRKLPPILTFALLRFLYDFKKGERYKDTTRFKFPMEVDMSPYCELLPVEDTLYELFSVVIHSGSTHSGHYTAYIRDVEELGDWTHPDDEPFQIPADPKSGKVDLIECNSPTELLQVLLRQLGGSASIDTLCKTMSLKTGVSWNKRFKKQFGSINKFLKSATEFFIIKELQHVSLKENMDTTTSDQTSSSEMDLDSTENFDSTASTGKEPEEGIVASSDPEGETSDISGGKTAAIDLLSVEGGHNESSGAVPPDFEMLDELPQDVVTPSGQQWESSTDVTMGTEGEERGEEESEVRRPSSWKKAKDPPPPGHRWFEFNDTLVNPILLKSIEKMFQGKQSAYMLFYRRKSMQRPQNAKEVSLCVVPERLQTEVTVANAMLEEDRRQYEIAVNTVKLNIHLSDDYTFGNGALQRLSDGDPCVVSIDRRKAIADLKIAIIEAIPELAGSMMVIHIAKHLPAGLHLYNCISEEDSSTMVDTGLSDGSHLFLWDGEQVGGETIEVGASCEPITLNVTYHSPDGEEKELVSGFAKNSTIGELRVVLADILACRPNQVTISQVKVSERTGGSCVVVLTAGKDKHTLEDLKFSDGDKIAAEKDIKKGTKTLAHSVADKQSRMLSFIVEDRCTGRAVNKRWKLFLGRKPGNKTKQPSNGFHYPLATESSSYPVFPLEVARDEQLSAMKTVILSRIGVKGDSRLRLDDDMSGLGPPLHENQTVTDAGLTPGQKVVLEPGPVPLHSQVVLQCKLHPRKVDSAIHELFLESNTTVAECCVRMVQAAGLEGDQWHLRKTNWCGEEADLLEDETATLEKEKIKSGDLLLIEEGKLPPKGYIRLPVYLYCPSSMEWGDDQRKETIAGIAEGFKSLISKPPDTPSQVEATTERTTIDEVPLHLLPPSHFYPPVPGDLSDIGYLQISSDSSIEDLKSMILTLPALEGSCVPTPGFLRVRELLDGRPAKVFKQPQQTLRRLKLTSSSHVCCTILPYEEQLPATAVVFNVSLRIPGERRYGPMTEVVYDTALSITPHGLRSHMSDLFKVPTTRIQLAKHKMESFQWIRIHESSYNSEKRGRKRGRGGATCNIKTSPVNLRDGDTIGVKDLQYDPDDVDDFSTPADDRGRAVLVAIQEEKRRKRKAKEGNDIFGGEPSRQKLRRPEVGIRIFVPDYQAKKQREAQE